jgi:SRSO17 transposase
MLPQIRNDAGIYPTPGFWVDEVDVERFMDELREYSGSFADCFARSEPRENFLRYLVGQLSPIERKSIEPMALHVEGAKVRTMQGSITDALWNEEKMLLGYQAKVREKLADPQGVMLFDESGFVKKGEDSAGVARQYCGTIGKVENCQVGVFAGYASRHGYALVDKELFVPESWFDEAHKEKREKLGFHEDLQFQTKPQLAAKMLNRLHQRLPFKYVACDSVYTESEDFIKAVEAHIGMIYFGQVSCDTLFWLQEPSTEIKDYRYRGQMRSRKIVPDTEKKPMRMDEFAKSLDDSFWYRRTVSEGSKGPIDYEFTRRRVTLCKDGLPYRTVWMVIKRSTDKKNRRYWFYISNAPLSTRLKTFVWLSGIRWAVEQCFEEAKSELGMDHYEVRKYHSWNRHMLITMLNHFFLWYLRILLGHKAPLLTLSQLRILLRAVLPLRVYDVIALILLIQWIQKRNHRAYLSHRKKRLREESG